MEMREFFLAQLEREAALTRKAIQRVPEGRNDFKPHAKSMDLGYLAALVASMPGWVAVMVKTDQLNLDDPMNGGLRPKVVETRRELLEGADKAVAEARQALEGTTDEHLSKPWRFVMGGRVISELPRHVMLTDSVFSHLAHHRGQLTVYLRLNEAAVPALYGPSADEHF